MLFVALHRDARNLWFSFLRPCLKSKKGAYSSRIKHSSIPGNTASTKWSTQKDISSDTLKAAVKKHNEELVIVNYASTSNETDNTMMLLTCWLISLPHHQVKIQVQ